MPKLKPVTTIFLRQFFLIKRSMHRLIGLFYWSALEIFLWGFLTVYIHNVGGAEFGFITVIIGAVILWNFLLRVQQGIAISFLEDVWTRNLVNLFASPLSIGQYLAGLVLTSIFTSLVALSFMTMVAWFLFTYNLFQFGFLMLPFIFILFFFGLALGLFTTATILRFGPSSEILAWSIPTLIPPFSGVFYPIDTLPSWLQPISKVLPSTHVFEGMRSIVLSGTFDFNRLIFASILAMVFFVIMYWYLMRSYRHVLRKGLFTRFMTE